MATNRWKHLLIVLIIALLVVSLLSIYFINSMSDELNGLKEKYSHLQTEYNSLRDQLGQTYFPSNPIYRQAGYPEIAYNGWLQYSPSLPNYTVYLRTLQAPGVSFKLGTLRVPVINFSAAIRLATFTANLDPTRYNLVLAYFGLGFIVNETLYDHPQWSFYFARVYENFWLYGSYAAGSSVCSAVISVDAFNGTVRSDGLTGNDPYLPTSGEHFEFKVNATEALQTVRMSDLKDVPKTLTANGTVRMIEPRIILLGPGSNGAFENPLDTSLSGKKRLCWIIELYSPFPEYGYFGTFAVDVETGKLVTENAEAGLPHLQYYTVNGAVIDSSAHNVTVSEQSLPIDGRIVGRSGTVPLIVPDVIVIRPGVHGSIGLNITSDHPQDVNVNLTMVNPLPDAQNLDTNSNPPGVSIRFAEQQVLVPGTGSSQVTLLFSAQNSAPQGTYLLKANFSYIYPSWNQPARGNLLFLLTVWNGEGQWPPPPIIGKVSS
jgi:hypothetical protein